MSSDDDEQAPPSPPLSVEEQEQRNKDYDVDNDRRIGWPDPLAQWTGGNDPASEYRLRLSGFKRNSRDEIMDALLTLAKHGITLDHLNKGHAEGEELPVSRDTKKIYYGQIEKGNDRSTANTEVPTVSMLRVGPNFVDFEVAAEDKTDYPAHLFTIDPHRPGEQWPRQRVREMHPSEIPTEAGDETLENNELDKYCVYRVFAGDYEDDEDEQLKGIWHSVRKAVDHIESFLHLKWWKNRPQ